MSFDQPPAIDDSARGSQESVLNVLNCLSLKNGFLCRQETPDYGVDLDVELLESSGVTGRKFCVQIKSSTALPTVRIADEDYVSYQFSTSRLGYLSRRQPGYGIVVLYDASKRTSYYDYVDEIVLRLGRERANDDWKAHGTVAIHIPTSNVLNDESARTIWTAYDGRFAAIAALFSNHAKDYNIPIISVNNSLDGLAATAGTVERLESYGFLLFNHHEIDILQKMLESMPVSRLFESAQIMLMAVLVHLENGRNVDAQYYLTHLDKKRSDLSAEEESIRSYCEASLEYTFGRIDKSAYRAVLQRHIESAILCAHNRFGLQIRLLWLDYSVASKDDILGITTRIDAIQEGVSASILPDNEKHLMEVYLNSVAYGLVQSCLVQQIARLRVTESIFGQVPLPFRVEMAKAFIRMNAQILRTFYVALKHAEKTEDWFLAAHSLCQISSCFFFFSVQSEMLSHGDSQDASRADESLFRSNLQNAIRAYNLFAEHGLLDSAYKCVTLAYDMCLLYRDTYLKPIEEELLANTVQKLAELGRTLGKGEYESIYEEMRSTIDRAKTVARLSDEEIGPFVDYFIGVACIPAERRANVVADVMNQRKFKEEMDDPHAELLQNLVHTKSVLTLYAEAPRSIISCKKCGLRTKESTDLDVLVSEWRVIHPHWCL